MRILVLSNKIPYPAIDGGSIATLNLSLSLAKQGNSVTLLAMNTVKHFFSVDNIPSHITNKIFFHIVDVPAKISILGAIKNLVFSSKPYNAARFYNSDYKKNLSTLLKSRSFDIIQLEGLYLGLYIPIIRNYSKAKIVYRAHNLEFEIWERASERTKILKKWYFKNLAFRLRKLEIHLLYHYDAILPISDKDGKWFLEQKPDIRIQTTPAGIGKKYINTTVSSEIIPDLFFIGALDWLPNQEGLLWFINNVWPRIHKKYSNLKFYLAGRNASAEIKSIKAPNLVFLGEVENASNFMQSHSIMVVPLFSGSGMRIKIIEAMALSKAIITTSMGLEGNPAKNNEHILIANNEEEFIIQIGYLLSNPKKIQELGISAMKFVNIHFDQEKIAEQLQWFYSNL